MDDAGIAPQSRKAVPGQYVAGSVRIAINGFGIGRLLLQALLESGRDDLVPIAINDLGSIETKLPPCGGTPNRLSRLSL